MRRDANAFGDGGGIVVKQAIAGPGNVQCNTGAWFGAQLGSTAWMLLAAAWMAPLAPAVAAVGLLCFILPNALGTWLWRRRDRMAPHPAFLLLMLLISGSGLLLLLTFDWFWPAAVPRESLWSGYVILLVVPVVMAGWYFLERGTPKERQRARRPEQAAGADQPSD